jgi:RNA polymerase sigma-70 factor (ECF subfamily)
MMTTGAAERERGIALAANHCADEQVKPGTDEEFMRELYERYRPQLQNYVVRLTRDVQWAEDVVQGALVRAWRARHKLTLGEAATRSWLFSAAYRIFVDDYRSRSVRPVTLTGRDLGASDLGDEAERLAWSMTLAHALSTLSESHRQAIVHVYYLHRTVDETASMLGISPGTVKSRLFYALRALRSQLTPASQESGCYRAALGRRPPQINLLSSKASSGTRSRRALTSANSSSCCRQPPQ